MPSIDELLGMPVEELEKLDDAQLLERYAEIFKLEPAVPLEEVSESLEELGEGEVKTSPVKRKKAESKAKIADLKKKLMEASRAGMSADDLFEKDFNL